MASVSVSIARESGARARRPGLPAGILKHLFLGFVAFVVCYPFFRMIASSFMGLFDATSVPPVLLPSELHPENYPAAWASAPWGRFFVNTAFVSIVTSIGDVATGVLAAYAFARMQFRGKNALFLLFLATYMVPSEATLIPNYVMMSKRGFNWFDTYQVQIVPFIASAFA